MRLFDLSGSLRTSLWAGVVFFSFASSPLLGQPDDLSKQRFFVNKFFDFPYRAMLNYRAWTLDDFKHNVDETVRVGFNTVQFTLPWNRVQDEDLAKFDWTYLDERLDYILRKYPDVWAMIIPDLSGQSFPRFVEADIESLGMRGIEGALWHYPVRDESRREMTRRLAIDSPQVQKLVTDYYRALAAHIRERYGPDHRMIAYEITLHQNMESDWWGLSSNVDYSRHAQTAFQNWLRRHYGSIDALNRAWGATYDGPETRWQGWVTPRYEDFDRVRMNSSGEAYVRRVDWLKYKYDSMDRWNKLLRDALKAGDPRAMLLWRGGGGLLMHERTVLFDMARYIDNIDWIILDDYVCDFSFSYFRGSMPDKLWGLEISTSGRPRDGDTERLRQVVAERAEQFFNLGGSVLNLVRYNTQEVQNPDPYKPAFVARPVELTKQPRVAPQARKAIYMSCFQTLRDSADFFTAHETYDRLASGGDVIDVISDGLLLKRPDRLRQYSEGIVVPLSEVLGREARAALITAAKAGVRVEILKPETAGTLDEYMRRTKPLAEDITAGIR